MPTFKVMFHSPVDPLFMRTYVYGSQFEVGDVISHPDFGDGTIAFIEVAEDSDQLLDITLTYKGGE